MVTRDQTKPLGILEILAVVMMTIADLVLVFGMYRARWVALRRAGRDTIWAGNFTTLMIIAVVFTALVMFLVWRGWLQAYIKRGSMTVIALWIGISIFGAFALPASNLIHRSYDAAFMLWGFLFNLGVILLLIDRFYDQLRLTAILRTIFLIGIGIVIPLIMLEFGLRAYFSFFGSEADKIAYVLSVDEALRLNNRYIGMPYINYAPSPRHEGHNAQGFRGEDIVSPKGEYVFRIFTLGGSTTYGSGLDAGDAYPAQLQRVLRQEYGYQGVEVVNAGVEAYSSHDSLANLSFKVLDYEPDMIIIYHAVNDVNARLLDPDVYSGINHLRGLWSVEKVSRNVSPFTLVRFLKIATVGYPNLNDVQVAFFNDPTVKVCTLRDECAALGMTPEEVLAANPPIYFERNMRNIIAVARANDVEVLFSTWGYYHGAIDGTSNVMTNEYYRIGVAEHNTITRELAAELQVPLIEFAESAPQNIESWLDTMHVSRAGAYEQASFFAQFIEKSNLFPDSARP